MKHTKGVSEKSRSSVGFSPRFSGDCAGARAKAHATRASVGHGKKQRLPPTTPARSGAAIVFGLIALLVASMLIAVLLRTAAMSHRQLKRDEFRMQASLLADAGIARAIARIQTQPEFDEEVWTVPADHFSFDRTAVVRWKIAADNDNQTLRMVSVTAEFPSGHPDVVRISRKLRIP